MVFVFSIELEQDGSVWLHLEHFVELDLGYAVPVPALSFSNDVLEHLLEGGKQTASASAGEQIVGITGVLCDDVGEGKGCHLVFL